MLRGASDAEATCRLMFHEAVVAASAEELHSFAYVIPDEARERCGKQLGLQREFSGGRVEWRLPVWQQSTRFSPVSEQGTQDIEVSATWDDDWINRGWYRASRDGIQPLRYQGFGAGIVMGAVFLGLLIGVVAGVAGVTITAIRRRQRDPGRR
jgi:hypothetical protein